MKGNLITVPFLLLEGAVCWVIVFLETYRHFPKMDKENRLELSITSATIMALMIIIVTYLFMSITINRVLR